MRGILLAFLAFSAASCASERVKQARSFRQAACGCTTVECVRAANIAYDQQTCARGLQRALYPCAGDLVPVKASEASQLELAELEADRCSRKLDPPPPSCGGVDGRRCPPGHRCVMRGESHPDKAGICYPDDGGARD